MHLISDLGDSAVLLPASLGLLAFLIGFGSRADALAYAGALVAGLMAALLAKLALATCGPAHPLFGVESPSGHAAFGAIFYGCLAVLTFATGSPIALLDWRSTAARRCWLRSIGVQSRRA